MGRQIPPWELDNQVPEKLAQHFQLAIKDSNMICEGGALETNGQGTLLTTEAVLLNPNRNTDWTQAQIEEELKTQLGLTQIIWLKEGIAGDDTDGHIDDLVRFVNEDTVVVAQSNNPDDPNYAILQQIWNDLQDITLANGKALQTIALPMPEPVQPPEDWRLEALPASYTNFLIANDFVFVPVFEQANDEVALKILQNAFPHHSIVAIDSRPLFLKAVRFTVSLKIYSLNQL